MSVLGVSALSLVLIHWQNIERERFTESMRGLRKKNQSIFYCRYRTLLGWQDADKKLVLPTDRVKSSAFTLVGSNLWQAFSMAAYMKRSALDGKVDGIWVKLCFAMTCTCSIG